MNGVQDPKPTWREWLMMAVFVPPLSLAAAVVLGVMFEGWVRLSQ